jgi:hypothetical protein
LKQYSNHKELLSHISPPVSRLFWTQNTGSVCDDDHSKKTRVVPRQTRAAGSGEFGRPVIGRRNHCNARELTAVAGESFTVTATEQIAGRLEVQAVKAYLGESWYRFEVPMVSTVIRIKAVQQVARAA